MTCKLVVFSLLLVACVSAAPSGFVASPVAYAAPAPIVTATSSQVVARNYNGLAAVAPVVPASPYVAAPYVAPAAAPYVAPAVAPYVAPYATPYAAAYAAPYAAPYSTPYVW